MNIIILHFPEEENEIQRNSVICLKLSQLVSSPLYHICFCMTSENCFLQALTLPRVKVTDHSPRKFLLHDFHENKALDSWNPNLKGWNICPHKDQALCSITCGQAAVYTWAQLNLHCCGWWPCFGRKKLYEYICEVFFGSSLGPCLEEYNSKIYAQVSINAWA